MLLKLLDQRRVRLAAAGLFAAEFKPLPLPPAVVAVVTSASGAVTRDMPRPLFGSDAELRHQPATRIGLHGALDRQLAHEQPKRSPDGLARAREGMEGTGERAYAKRIVSAIAA